ncbi:outer membrane lipoprotein carrier protein LolA [soil metagenome]
MSRRTVKWIPAVAATALVGAVAIAVPLSANADAGLPSKTAAQVLALVASSTEDSFSGTISQDSNLGIPDLSSLGASTGSGSGSDSGSTDSDSTDSDSSASSLLSLLTGSYTARIYVDGTTKARVEVLDKLAERDVIRSGSDVWLYDSSEKSVIHTTIPSKTDATPTPTPGASQSPSELAKLLIDKLEPSTKVTVGDDLTVAGRSAYDLVLTPKASETLVASVSVAVDSDTGLPLSVTVKAAGQSDPAFSTEFTKIDLSTPSASNFDFTPPAGAKVTEETVPTTGIRHPGPVGKDAPANERPTMIGSGWDAIVSIPANAKTAKLLDSPLYESLTSAVTGGRLAHTALVNIYVTTDGRILAGSVPAAKLEAAAATK